MIWSKLYPFLAFCTSLFISLPLAAQPETLKVGVAGSPPFVIGGKEHQGGIAVEIWQELAQANNISYKLLPQEGVKAGLAAVASGEIDILVGPISITASRLQQLAFTQPYYEAKIGLLIPVVPPTVWSRVKPLFRAAVISSTGFLVLALFTVGNLLWLVEHRHNEKQFPKPYLSGVGSGMWFALVTLTTVGYGDKAPVTKAGKFITSIWMLVTMVAASSLTAGIATAMTLIVSEQTAEEFTRPQDIENLPVAVVKGTTGASWASFYKADILAAPDLSTAVNLVLAGRAEAVVFDVPALQYYLNQYPTIPLKVSQVSFASENYGFALPLDSSLVNSLNVTLLQLKEKGAIAAITDSKLKNVANP